MAKDESRRRVHQELRRKFTGSTSELEIDDECALFALTNIGSDRQFGGDYIGRPTRSLARRKQARKRNAEWENRPDD